MFLPTSISDWASDRLVFADEPRLSPAPFRIAAPGSVFRYQILDVNDAAWLHRQGLDGTEAEWIVGETDGFLVNCTLNGNPSKSFVIAGNYANTVSEAERKKLAAIWPLQIGKTVTYSSAETTRVYTWVNEISVLGTETLDLGNTKIDTFAVRWRQQLSDPSGALLNRDSFRRDSVTWFAPSIGWFVIKESAERSSLGPVHKIRFQLSSYRRTMDKAT
jgi:hypothetical protein